MALKQINRASAKRVMGIDCSTHSLAFTIFQNRRPVQWGKINFEGADVFERMHDARQKLSAVRDIFDVDFIAFESAILAKVANADVTIKLSMVYGVAIAELMRQGTKVVTVQPLSWASFIGVPNLTVAEKDRIKADSPGYSKSWYQAKGRELRKQRIIDYAKNKWDFWETDDSDVADSHGIAYFAYHQLTTRS